MNHRFSRIGFFVFWLIMTVLMLGLVGLTFGDKKKEKQTPEAGEAMEALQTTTSAAATADEGFQLVEENGFVAVIDQNGTIYEYTDISLSHLPSVLQDEIRQGKRMSSILEVYSFLENYSS